MGLRTAHGSNSEAMLVVEVLPADEQPAPIPVNLAHLPPEPVRRADGTIADPETAKRIGARGGLAKASKRANLQRMGLAKLTEESKLYPYWKAGMAWQVVVAEEYAMASGGVLGPAAESKVGNAAILLCASRYYSDLAFMADNERDRMDYFKFMSVLQDRQRQQLLSAYELANRFGAARGQIPVDPYAMFAKIERIAPPSYDDTQAIDVESELVITK
jgi:hypothetical protein